MKAITRVLIAMVASIAALFVSTGTSNAGLDNELSVVDGQGRTLTVQQWDLSLIHISEPTRRLRGSRMPSSA